MENVDRVIMLLLQIQHVNGAVMFIALMVLVTFCTSNDGSVLRIQGAKSYNKFLKKARSIKLDSSKTESLIGQIENIAKFKNYIIVICSEMEFPVKIYTIDGHFVKNLARVGTGPRELKGSTVHGYADNSLFYLLDGFGRQIFVYDEALKLVEILSNREITKNQFVNAIWIASYKNKIALFNGSGQSKFGACLVTNHQFKWIGPQTEVVKKYRYRSGGVLFHKEKLYYIDANDPWLYVYSLDGVLLKKVICAKPTWPVVTSEYLINEMGENLEDWGHKKWEQVYSEKRHINSIFSIGDYIVLDYITFIIVYNVDDDSITPYNGLDLQVEGSFENTLIAVSEDLSSESNPNLMFFQLVH